MICPWCEKEMTDTVPPFPDSIYHNCIGCRLFVMNNGERTMIRGNWHETDGWLLTAAKERTPEWKTIYSKPKPYPVDAEGWLWCWEKEKPCEVRPL